MLAAALTGAVGWVDGAGRTMWDVIWPMTFVLGGVIGLVGLIRMLAVLSGGERPFPRSRLTAAMILIGLIALVSFNLYGGNLPGNFVALLVYYVLPGIGSIHLLYLGREIWFPRRTMRHGYASRAGT